MGLLQAITFFFESLFNKNSPEVQKKIQMKKLDKEISAFQPLIFKNGRVLPNFAEACRLLYINTKPINELLYSTICGPDAARNRRFEAQLVVTGFSSEGQKIVESLSYEERKKQLENTAMTTSQIFDHQHKALEKITHELGTPAFAHIDKDLNLLNQLFDLSKFSFVTVLQVFDPNFISADLNYQPAFQEIYIDRMVNILEDMYYLIAGLKLSNSTLNALIALESLRKGTSSLDNQESEIADNVKKIAYILKHIISEEKIKLLIAYGRNDINYVPKKAKYELSARRNFNEMIQVRFNTDEQRIKSEMKDEKINNELSRLFGDVSLLRLNGYNNETNAKLLANAQVSFTWIMPMQILKTFLFIFMTEPIRLLLNNIVIEGFFNNSQFKTEFAADIFAALESSENLQAFEDSFASGKPNDVAMIEGYIRDAHKDPDFFKKLEMNVNNINAQASKLISREINSLNKLSKHLELLIQDAKKPASEIISNLKVLMMSSRNRDNSDLLEKQYPKWEIFFEIMKNYAIINS